METLKNILEKEIIEYTGHKVKHILSYYLAFEVTRYTLKTLYWRYRNIKLRQRAAQYLENRNKQIYPFEQLDPKLVEEVLELDISQIRQKLFKGELKSVQLVNIFGNRCQTVGRDCRYVTEERYEIAMKEAIQRDQERQEAIANGTLDKLPILHGIPISVKEQFEMAGTRATVGCDFLMDVIFTEDCPTIKVIKESGAIILVKGNLPQVALSLHSSNRLYGGTCQNPYDRTRSCGGSSGGDAGLVASRCVPLAIGTDLGGSQRIPGHFCGLRAFKFTQHRVSFQGIRGILEDNFSQLPHRIKPTSGPLGKSVDDLVVTTKILLETSKYDITVPPMPFNQELFQEGLKDKFKIGYIETMDTAPASISAQRAVKMVREKLESLGYELVKFELDADTVSNYKDILYGLAGNLVMYLALQRLEKNYELPMPTYYGYKTFLFAGPLKRWALKTLLNLSGNQRLVRAFKYIKPLSKDELEQLMKRQNDYIKSMKKKWEDLGIKALIMPSYPIAAFKDENSVNLGGCFEYQLFWNVLSYPAGIIPVTEVQESEETYSDNYNDMLTKAIQKDIIGSRGMPVSIQVVAQSWEDERCLGLMKVIDEQFKFNKIPQL